MYLQELCGYIDQKEEEMVKELCEFIKIPSISTDLEKVEDALMFAIELSKKLGFEAKGVINNQVGVIEIGQGSETLGILSHVDVVDPGDMSVWKTDPFQPAILDKTIYGRGTLDDKGAIIASLYAMKAVSELGLPFKKKIQLILGTQEEVKWTDMNAYVKEYPLPDYGFTPDGEFPICNIEKGGIDFNMVLPLGELVGEENGEYLVNISAGTADNIVPGKCKALILQKKGSEKKEETIEAVGKAVHSCQPEKGDNAIFKMVEKLKAKDLKSNKLLEIVMMASEKFKALYGEDVGVYSDSEYYNNEFVHRTVFSPTKLYVENRNVVIHINVRFAYGEDSNNIIKAFEKIALEFNGTMQNVIVMPAVYVSKERPFLHAFANSYEDVMGIKNEYVLAYGGSYAKAIPNVVSWGPIFPGDEDTCHEENEYITIKCLLDNAKIFAVALSKIVFSESSYK